ncbi:MAG: DUF4397 domain-containing protein [Pseudonocardia sp.]|uniref:DUF4397 domain-containing protein n=1 Tax=unclassified Pseudonocardia TaxID=2619320 RepID=UPI0008698E27|nr:MULTISPECIES: DUF4397 domain-containing protein [unclassified Pseudonocardia]MBN9113678.1 DUF4397 domain-containing protein [Pseudonocardia sp.]ODU28835.1 MAG: hypothetical protein ABS80_02295 [Pseudonocardia sp. SCN 72-51]
MRRLITALGIAVLAAFACAGPANAATGTYLRLAHLSPDTPDVDVLVTSFSGTTTRLAGVGYGDVSSYTRIEPGTYTVQMRMAGAPDSTPPIVSTTLRAQAGDAYTAAGLGMRDGLSLRVLDDDLTPPPPGQARVRVVQGAEQSGPVAVRWDGTAMAAAVGFGDATGYVDVPAGRGTFDVNPTTGDAAQLPVSLDAGGVYSVVLVQRAGRLSGEVRTDAAGPGRVPVGGVETGMGGTAGPSTGPLIVLP